MNDTNEQTKEQKSAGEHTIHGSKAAGDKPQVRVISERKREANRKNARRSTGPRTATGKSRSRWNAIKHGLLVNEVPANLFPFIINDPGLFRSLMEALVHHFDPVGPVEGMLVENIARCYWRQRRSQLAENAQIRLALSEESVRACQRTSQTDDDPDTRAIFKQARQSIDRLGYVDAASQELILKRLYLEQQKEELIAANQKTLELVRGGEPAQSSPELERQRTRARSTLLRRLDECEHTLQLWDEQMERIRNENRRASFAQHLVLDYPLMEKFLRYEKSNQRELYCALDKLEHLQRQRLGDAVPQFPKLTM